VTTNANQEFLDERTWRDRLEGLHDYSFFATPTWGRVLAGAGLGYRSQAIEFEYEGRRALLPFARKDLGGRTQYVSCPFGTYGGLIPLEGDPRTAGPDIGAAVARQFTKNFPFGLLLAYPGPHRHFPFPSTFDRYNAYVINLESSGGTVRIMESMRTKTRQYVRKAERTGVLVETDESREGFQTYYRLLEASSARWGRSDPGKPWALFESVQRHAERGSARLWAARVGDQCVAGLLCFYGKGEVFAWSAALDEHFVDTRANYLLHWRAISDAADRGFDTFNLGANEGLEGVRWFKEGLGAQPREYPAYSVAGTPYLAARWLKRQSRRAFEALNSVRNGSGKAAQMRTD
jgi:CelD/BcsL family acetyltransferase involved in cellulose biosynthesis